MTQVQQPEMPAVVTARHVPVRTCVGCRAAVPQVELVRVVLVGGRAVADPARRASGRGAWVHPRRECLGKGAKGGYARALRAAVSRADAEAIAGIAIGGRQAPDMSTCSGQGGGNAVESVPVPSATD